MSDDHVTLPDEDPTEPSAGEGPTEVVDEHGAAVDPDAPPPPLTCAECGAHLEPEQQYCLECGAPTPSAVPLRARKNAAALVAASLLALGVGGGALIYALTTEEGGTSVASVSVGGTTPTTLPPVTTNPFPTTGTTNPFPTDSTDFFPPTTATGFFPTTTGTTTNTTTSTDTFDETDDTATDDTSDTSLTTDTTDTTDTDSSDDWTATTTAYTVVLFSYRSRTDAEDKVDEVRDDGVTAGVIVSDNYSSLNAGYYVVFHGTYTTQALATAELNRIKSSYPNAYVRKVEE